MFHAFLTEAHQQHTPTDLAQGLVRLVTARQTIVGVIEEVTPDAVKVRRVHREGLPATLVANDFPVFIRTNAIESVEYTSVG